MEIPKVVILVKRKIIENNCINFWYFCLLIQFPELGLPQVVPLIQDLLDEYTTKPENLPIHALDKNLRHVIPIAARNLDSIFTFHSRSLPLVQRVNN